MLNDNNLWGRDSYKLILDNLCDGVYFVDTDRTITYWNKAAEEITGYKAEEVIGKCCKDNILMHVDCEGKLLCLEGCPLQSTIEDGISRQAEVFLHHKEGHRVPVLVKSTKLCDESNNIVGAVEVFTDNTAKTELAEKFQHLKELAYIDELTKVPNRRYMEKTIQAKQSEANRYNWKLGLLFVDIDHFKQFNDTYGHDLGDIVLKMVAKTMLTNCRPFDVTGRWGGEEFIVLLTCVKDEDLYNLADRLRMLVEQSKVERESETLQVTISVGATLARADDSVEQVIKRADSLLYKSKEAGRNRVTTDIMVPAVTTAE